MPLKNVLEPVYLSATAATPLLATSGVPVVQSLAASFNTIPTSTKYMDNLSYQINVITSNSTGNFYLQGSNDGLNFSNLMPCGVVSGVNDQIMVDINQFPFAQLRLSYVSTVAGSGTCNILITGRSLA